MKRTLTMLGTLLLAGPVMAQQTPLPEQGQPGTTQTPPGAAQNPNSPTQPAPGAASAGQGKPQQPSGVPGQQPSGGAPQPPATAQHQQQGAQTNWEAEGRIVEVDDDGVKISRQGAAPAEFDLRKDTKIRIDGREATAKELKPGTEIRVRFDLDEDETVAKEIETR